MKDTLRLRAWAGPLTIGSFAVVAVTGILMFFKASFGLMKLAHEWLSLCLVFGVVAHIVLNWKPFLGYFRKGTGVSIMAAFLVMGILASIPALLPAKGQFPRGGAFHPQAYTALEQSSLSVVAHVAKKSPESLSEDLRAKGIRVRDNQQTLPEIAAENKVGNMVLLSYIFGGAQGQAKGRPPR